MSIILYMQLCLSKRNVRFDKNTASPAWRGLGRYRTIDFSICGLGDDHWAEIEFRFIIRFELGEKGWAVVKEEYSSLKIRTVNVYTFLSRHSFSYFLFDNTV